MEFTEQMKSIMLKAVGTLTREEVIQMATVPRNEVVKFQLENGFKAYKAKEGREEFVVVAKDMDDAKEQANVWNAVIIGTIKNYKAK